MGLPVKKTSAIGEGFVNIIVYGESGTGKTSLCKTLDESKTLIVSLEDGLLSLQDSNFDYVNAKTIDDILGIISDPDMEKYQNVVVDSITELSQNTFLDLKNKYAKKEKQDDKKQGAYSMQLWGEFGEKFSILFKELRRMQKSVIALALVSEKEDETGVVKNKPDVYGKSAERIIAWFDECWMLVVDADGSRKFLTEKTTKSWAKDRSGRLEKLEDANLKRCMDAVLGRV